MVGQLCVCSKYLDFWWLIYRTRDMQDTRFVHLCVYLCSITVYFTYILYVISLELRPVPRTVYPKKYAHGFCFAVLCCGYTLTDFPISIRLTSLALWQSNDCPSASKMWIHYEQLHNHNKAKHNKTVCIFLGIYCNPEECRQFAYECRQFTMNR